MEFDSEFLDKTPNEQGIKESNKFISLTDNFIKLSFKIKKKLFIKGYYQGGKTTDRMGEKICESHI